ncbi:DEAD/DEAH box helicase [Skermanella pratensis]|uniref:DEAD/DEAH box helicase n=1 Tax=Skermanella pratensis TaxID=2233999 RepID=UPI0013010F0B|nr:DEAD/DEAH box helicase [Skermanella pratensis]
MTSFSELGLSEPILRAISAENYSNPTPIQAQAVPHLIQGRDLLGVAQTGTGKTAAFALPILHRLSENRTRPMSYGARVLVLTPTRELAIQIGESFATYGRHLPLTRTVIFGGVGQNPQVQSMARGVDILVATPGRLLDLIGQGFIKLDRLEVFVLDEADRMLDMGFIHDVRRVIKVLPTKRHTLFFSATMPPEIAKLADKILTEPVRVEVTPVSSTAERIEQRIMFVEKADKRPLLGEVLKRPDIGRALVFTRTKHGANRVVEQLGQIAVRAEAIHGNKSQTARQRALENFRSGEIRVLVATDIAARGIDIDGITHVINYDLPNVPESYVHRIGRTARAGTSGIAISFCDSEERAYLKDIEKLIKVRIPVVEDHPWHSLGGVVQADPDARPPLQDRRPQRHGRPAQGRQDQTRQAHGQGQGRPAQAQQGRPPQGNPSRRRSGR